MGEYLDYRADVEDVQFLVNDLAFKMYNQGRADKYQEIVSEYMLLTEKQVEDIRADERVDTIDECIQAINDLHIEYAYPHTICNILEHLKEQK